jgi:hypothetical protein
MSFTLTTPVTGGAQTGFTTPTYTIVQDTVPANFNGKQYAVSALGGTQTGVDSSSSPSRPFTITLRRPIVLRALPAVNGATGILPNVPMNTYVINVRKGVTPLAGQAARVLNASLKLDVPAGADVADAANIRAALSLLIGSLSQISASIGDTLATGVI